MSDCLAEDTDMEMKYEVVVGGWKLEAHIDIWLAEDTDTDTEMLSGDTVVVVENWVGYSYNIVYRFIPHPSLYPPPRRSA